jgi:hypothetical protein
MATVTSPLLKELDVSQNQLTSLPTMLSATGLKTLDLSRNNLKGLLPRDVFLPDAAKLDLSHNAHTHLNHAFVHMTALTELRFSRNELVLAAFPEDTDSAFIGLVKHIPNSWATPGVKCRTLLDFSYNRFGATPVLADIQNDNFISEGLRTV